MSEMLTLVSHDKGKFGRILGELYVYENVDIHNLRCITQSIKR